MIYGLCEANSWETYALVVDDLNNGRQAAGVRSVVEEDNTADFHHPPLRGLDVDICLTHCDGYALDNVSLVFLSCRSSS